MLTSYDHRAGLQALMILGLAFAATAAHAESLTLIQAQDSAVLRDAGRGALEGEASAMRDRAVAAGELPDPEARIGLVNVPADTLAFDRDDMTMIEFGLMQRFPAGRSRALSRERLEHHALHYDAEAELRAREVRLVVARLWRELDYFDATTAILAEARDRARLLVTGTTAAYASGAGDQTNLIDARLAALAIEETLIARERERESAMVEMTRWIGRGAANRLPAPAPSPLAPIEELRARLAKNPRLRSLEHEAGAARFETELARERYKPAFGIGLGYGIRQGRDMAGMDRSDMLSAMLSFDLPLFTRDRQERDFAAARSMQRSAEARREDAARDLEARLSAVHVMVVRLQQTLDLYGNGMIPLTNAAVDSAFAAYRAGDGSLTEVIATQRRHLDVRQRELRLRADLAIALAEVESLAGDTP